MDCDLLSLRSKSTPGTEQYLGLCVEPLGLAHMLSVEVEQALEPQDVRVPLEYLKADGFASLRMSDTSCLCLDLGSLDVFPLAQVEK